MESSQNTNDTPHNVDLKAEEDKEKFTDHWLFKVGVATVAVIALLQITFLGLNIYNVATYDPEPLTISTEDSEIDADVLIAEMRSLQERSNDAVSSAELILSFLEGATVLIGVLLAAAGIYGFARIDEIRDKVDKQLQPVVENRQNLQRLGELNQEIERYRSELQEQVDKAEERLQNNIQEIAWILQADQEYRSKNYEDAHDFVQRALKLNERNTIALYLAGWLEIQYLDDLPNGLDSLTRLQEVLKEEDKSSTYIQREGSNKKVRLWSWKSAQAVYGVGLRYAARLHMNKGREENDEDLIEKGTEELQRALDELETALSMNPKLMDINDESFWGPVGGVYRELGRWKDGIRAYKNALKHATESSYPQGNLAALQFRYAKEADPAVQEALYDEAIMSFEETIRIAEIEQQQKPKDYYLFMDLSMAHIMCTLNIPEAKREAHIQVGMDYLDKTLKTDPSCGELRTSLLAGWKFLYDSLPDSEKWDIVHIAINKAIKIMQEAIGEQCDDDDVIENNEAN